MIERAVILSTGDELTTGKVVDTNSNYLADKLVEAGVEVAAVLTVGDVAERIIWAWQQAIEKADLIISTGGIGPTADDLTTELVAKIAGVDLFFSEEVAENIRRLFASLKRPMPDPPGKLAARDQAGRHAVRAPPTWLQTPSLRFGLLVRT